MDLKNSNTFFPEKTQPILNSKEKGVKAFVHKHAFVSCYSLVLFAYKCDKFYVTVNWKDYLSSFSSTNRNIVLPSPDVVNEAFLSLCTNGSLSKIYNLPLFDIMFYDLTDFDGHIVQVSLDTSHFVHEFIRVYSKFYNSFDKKNFIIY